MKRVLVWLMLALLPWRLWAADAMIWSACVPVAHPAVHAGAVQDHAGFDGHHDHGASQASRTHASWADADAQLEAACAHGENPVPGSHAHCTLCDICHNTPLAAVSSSTIERATPHMWPVMQSRLPPTPAPGDLFKPPRT